MIRNKDKAMPEIRLIVTLLIILACNFTLSAQEGARKQIRQGNKAYEKGDYRKAEEYYRKALGRDAGKFSLHGHHNLGNALYKQENYSEAFDHLRLALDEKQDSTTINRLYYNFGNAALQRYLNRTEDQQPERSKELIDQSIKAYAKALQYAPEDEDARHNLTLALMMKQQQEQQEQQQQQQEQHTQDQQKHEQLLPETSISEETQKTREPEHQEGNISREDAERMLNAIREKEMKTAEQIHERERRRTATGKTKDW